MAHRVAALITDEFGVPWVRVSVHKPWAIRGSRDVGITVERGQRPA
jgi:dihydroneopterin aldolase